MLSDNDTRYISSHLVTGPDLTQPVSCIAVSRQANPGTTKGGECGIKELEPASALDGHTSAATRQSFAGGLGEPSLSVIIITPSPRKHALQDSNLKPTA